MSWIWLAARWLKYLTNTCRFIDGIKLKIPIKIHLNACQPSPENNNVAICLRLYSIVIVAHALNNLISLSSGPHSIAYIMARYQWNDGNVQQLNKMIDGHCLIWPEFFFWILCPVEMNWTLYLVVLFWCIDFRWQICKPVRRCHFNVTIFVFLLLHWPNR